MGQRILPRSFGTIFLLVAVCALAIPQEHDFGFNPEVIRGEVWVDLEPLYGDRPDIGFYLDKDAAGRRALQETATYFAAMIYGWSFHYDIGERARGIAEDFDVFELMGEIPWGDPLLNITEVERKGMRMLMAADYHLSESQQKRMQMWRMNTVLNAQGRGSCPLQGPAPSPDDGPDSTWLNIRNAALKDAARAAVRQMLRASERNRPKEVTGYISLASFPRFLIASGQWVAVARFRVQINEIIPFAAY